MIDFEANANPLRTASPSSWDELIEAIGPASLLVIIRSRLGASLRSRVHEEDILQEALLCAWRDRTRFEWRGLKSFRAWLLTIIDHRIRDLAAYESAQKRGGGELARALSLTSPFAADSQEASFIAGLHSTTPSRIAMYKEQAAAIEDALNALPTELQPVVRLRVIEQKPIEEVASLLGIGPSAVRHRLYKGAELYRSQLRAEYTSRSLPMAEPRHGASGADAAST